MENEKKSIKERIMLAGKKTLRRLGPIFIEETGL